MNSRDDLDADPFDVASGDMNAVARRVEEFFDQDEDQSWLEQAHADIKAGRTIPLGRLTRQQPGSDRPPSED